MNKYNCLIISSPSFCRDQHLIQEAQQIAKRLVLNERGEKWDEETIISLLNSSKADAAIIGTEPMTARVIYATSDLKAIGKYGVGLDNIDLEALSSRNIFFGWTPGVNRRSVVELALSFMLGHCRNVFRSSARMQDGRWHKEGGVNLSGKTVGIVGLGHIGSELAQSLKFFGCRLLYCDIINKNDVASLIGAESKSYDQLIAESDIISFHVPGNVSTQQMYSSAQVQMAKYGQFVINTSRGNVVDFDCACEAVISGKLSGFAADVFPKEPFVNAGKYRMEDGFYFTPHIGGNSAEAVRAMGLAAIDGLKSFLLSVSNQSTKAHHADLDS